MRVAFITLGFVPLRTSGLDISGERLVRALLGAGHHVTVIAGGHEGLKETWNHPALEIHRVQLGRSNWVGFAYGAAQLLKRLECARPFDIVHFWDVHFAYAYAGHYVASLHHSFRQRWSIWEQNRGEAPAKVYRFTYYTLARRLAEIPSARGARGLLAISATTRMEFIEKYGIAPERIVLARHGIDTDFFRPSRASSQRTRLGLAPGESAILFAGFVTPRKGLELLAQALPLIRPAPRLLIVGRWNDKFRSRFYQQLGSAANQVIECGFVPDELMPSYYSTADLYVSASLMEGFGLPLAEALACETPVVATEGGATAEVVGLGGLLTPARDPVALADAISRLLVNPMLRREMGAKGREHISREFSLQQMTASVLDAYEKFSQRNHDAVSSNTHTRS